MAGQDGIVYLLTNESMPNFVRLDFTQKDDVAERVQRLNKGSVPMPFSLYFAARVPDCLQLERTLHLIFGERRMPRNREFFKINPDLLRAVIELAATDRVELSDKELAITSDDRLAMNQMAKRQDALEFRAIGLEPSTVLGFAMDKSIFCTVNQNGKVTFDGREMSPADAALEAVRSIGFTWNKVSSGRNYWLKRGDMYSDELAAGSTKIRENVAEQLNLDPQDDDSPVLVIRRREPANSR